jgi:polysaccharide deacetylase 2 family uncharacterized protein YibQ
VKKFPFLAVVIAAALIAAVVLYMERVDQKPDGSDARGGPEKETPKKVSTGRPSRSGLEPVPPGTMYRGRRVAIIIDDIGFDLKIVRELAHIPEPIAFAVLPHTPHAVKAAEILRAAGKEILLHLPMEPRFYPGQSPGPGALMVDMDEEEIRKQIREDLSVGPFVSGVNNHMGSRFMEDEKRLDIVMDELRKRELFFVDSRTTADTRGRECADRAGVRFAERTVFIDNAPGYATALENLTGALRKKQKDDGPILIIGHPHRETVQAIRNVLSIWRKKGVEVIPVSACLRISDRAGR